MNVKPYVLGVDPGQLTGLCLIKRDTPEVISSDELAWLEASRYIDQTLREYGGENVHVVVEKYTITPETAKKSPQPWSLEVTGMARLLAAAHGAGAITQYTPADAKSFASNPRLKQLGLWHVGGGGHALDAMRHALLYMTRSGFKDSRLLLK